YCGIKSRPRRLPARAGPVALLGHRLNHGPRVHWLLGFTEHLGGGIDRRELAVRGWRGLLGGLRPLLRRCLGAGLLRGGFRLGHRSFSGSRCVRVATIAMRWDTVTSEADEQQLKSG